MSRWTPRALHLRTASGAIVEIMATCCPYGRASLAAPDDTTLSLRVSIMSVPHSVRLSVDDGRQVVDAGYLTTPGARGDLREAVRAATSLAHSAPLSRLVRTWLGPDPATVRDDTALDGWIAARLGTSMHLCATARMGPPSDRLAVVDQFGRVRGVDGLRVVDLSILPSVPTRGPACTAIAVAEHLASTFG
jgi:choline dehydrogenase-like flavoprotein